MFDLTLYRGTPDPQGPLFGTCWTDEREIAAHFSADSVGGKVERWDVVDDVKVLAVEGYDHDTNTTPADDDELLDKARVDHGADLVSYTDEDDRGRQFTCYRVCCQPLPFPAIQIIDECRGG